MATQRIAFKEWLPDQPSILDSVSEANNVIPLAVGYGPFKSAVTYSGAASEALNNVFAAKLDNDVFIFAGGASKLFKVDNTDLSLVDESKSGGYTGTGRWQFLQFGNLALAANGSEKIQAYDVNSSTAFADASSDAPIAKYITAVRDFVVAANIGAGTTPNKVQWSGINDATTWTTTATSQSDFQLLPDGGDITGIVGGEFGIVFLEKAIVRMSYIGANIADIDSISTAVDPERNLVIWNYGNISGGRSLLIYNFETQKWCEADTDVDFLSTLATSGTTLDGLDSAYNVTAGSFVVGKSYTIRTVGSTDFTLIGAVANTVGVLFTATGAGSGTGVAIDMAASAAALKTVDSLVTTLDDRLYKGGKFLFGGVRGTRIITFTGANATGSIITNDLEYGYNSVLTLIRPSVDNGSASVSVASRRMLDDTITYGSSVTASQEDRCSVRSAGRYHRIALTPTGANWSSAIGMDINYSEQGTR